MIRIERHAEVAPYHGKFCWTCPRFKLEGRSSQPLLDACRAIKSLPGIRKAVLRESAAIFREGHAEADLVVSSISYGASITAGSAGFDRYRSGDDDEPMAEAAE
jgi:hypothetical protein